MVKGLLASSLFLARFSAFWRPETAAPRASESSVAQMLQTCASVMMRHVPSVSLLTLAACGIASAPFPFQAFVQIFTIPSIFQPAKKDSIIMHTLIPLEPLS